MTKGTPRRKNRILLESGTNEVEFLRFFLGSSYFGINVAKVRKAIVYEREKLSVVPGSVRGLLGNYLYRGECLPIVDLCTYFKLDRVESNSPQLLLLCEYNCYSIGFLIDRIRDIMRCSWENFIPPSASGLAFEHECLTGNVVWYDEVTPVLDVEALLVKIVPGAGICRDAGKLTTPIRSENAGRKILYCEDSPTVQRTLLKCLAELGFNNIVAFATGREGLEYLRTHTGSVDLIISDIEMPGMDGLTLCHEIQSVPEAKKIPFIFFSSTVTDEMREKCKLVGGTASFSKPEIQQLTQYVDQTLNGGLRP